MDKITLTHVLYSFCFACVIAGCFLPVPHPVNGAAFGFGLIALFRDVSGP